MQVNLLEKKVKDKSNAGLIRTVSPFLKFYTSVFIPKLIYYK